MNELKLNIISEGVALYEKNEETNKYILKAVFSNNEDSDNETGIQQELFAYISDTYFNDEGRYSKNRLYICKYPGDKCENKTAYPEYCPVCGKNTDFSEFDS